MAQITFTGLVGGRYGKNVSTDFKDNMSDTKTQFRIQFLSTEKYEFNSKDTGEVIPSTKISIDDISVSKESFDKAVIGEELTLQVNQYTFKNSNGVTKQGFFDALLTNQ